MQDALLVALKAGRAPLSNPADLPWLNGVLRNRAAMRARTGARRSARERDYGSSMEDERGSAEPAMEFDALLAPMAPAARAVAILVLHGLTAEEIRWIHRLSATAFRQRLTSIRKSLKSLPADLRGEALATALHRPGIPGLETGLIRRALRATLARMPAVGSHDPDGHLILISLDAHRSGSGGN